MLVNVVLCNISHSKMHEMVSGLLIFVYMKYTVTTKNEKWPVFRPLSVGLKVIHTSNSPCLSLISIVLVNALIFGVHVRAVYVCVCVRMC